MKFGYVCAIVACMSFVGSASAGEKFKLPPEVTPKLRAACESDVRRLCIGKNPTVAKVKRCVLRKFVKLGRRCQIEIAAAGFKR